MLNYIWFGLIAIAVVTGLLNGTIDAVTEAAFASARQAVDLAIGLIGAMALWLGIMRIADKAGLVAVLARGAPAVSGNPRRTSSAGLHRDEYGGQHIGTGQRRHPDGT